MSSSILERNESLESLSIEHVHILAVDLWGLLHRAGLDNCHIDLCWEIVAKVLLQPEEERDKEHVRALLCEKLPQIPLDQVMGVIFL